MTDAWGAVVAAVAAGVFGIIGILAGILVGRRQTIDQAHVEHEQWLRGQRQETYVAYLTTWDSAMKKLCDVIVRLRQHVDPQSYAEGQAEQQRMQFFATTIGELTRPVGEKCDVVQLLGPDGAADAAAGMKEVLEQLAEDVANWGMDEPLLDEVAGKLIEFGGRLMAGYEPRGLFLAEAKSVLMTPARPGSDLGSRRLNQAPPRT